ncbi:MFS transporter [Solimonas sp. SE-A11]|uniref:MFS transporter n=1 Tax=Solimonas sp. SE-A11 TaxID=3054954 RepID=UPI00259C9A52|nr:MFS transporter [Solimonas sp. SE-A11]MDM4769962.1 MFS transporter [Solimonas sp. SE-A11]
MSAPAVQPSPRRWAAFEPLRERSFLIIWSASLLSNLGQLIQGVGAAWEMTRLSSSPGMVALVQTALMLPLMLVAVPAGAIADMFDRRKVAMLGLSLATLCAATLTALSGLGLVTPWLLLVFCFLIGSGVALYGPAWQASVIEQVKPETLPAAVALSSVSYNIARSFGPAVGGLLVVTAGAMATFAINAVFYLPLLLAFYMWQRRHVPPRLPPERLHRAIISGARYAIHAPPVRSVMVRGFATGFAGASLSALTPLVARDLLHGNASTYGILLGAMGIGAIAGALAVSEVRERFKAETAVSLCSVAAGLMVILLGLSHSLLLSVLIMAVAGVFYLLHTTLLSVGVQLSTPRWVAARALSWFQSALTGGIALGAWFWGAVTTDWGLQAALIVSGTVLMLTPLVGRLLPMPPLTPAAIEPFEIANEPEVALAITPRSGPIVIEIEYRVAPEQARAFYQVMQQLQGMRLRNGAFDWSLARDIADAELWTERYHCPTWGDYLRQRSRFTQGDRALQLKADSFHTPGSGPRVHRRLERPLGSVRWHADVPDNRSDHPAFFNP